MRDQADEARGEEWWAEYQASKAQQQAKNEAQERSGSIAKSLDTLEVREEGWYRDPYELHEARWYSVGRPTELVLDHGQEGRDPPPQGSPPQAPKPLPGSMNAAYDRRAGVGEPKPVASPPEDGTSGERSDAAKGNAGGSPGPVNRPIRILLSVLASVAVLLVVGLVEGQWGPWKHHGPTTTTKFNNAADVSAAKFERASAAVATGCGAVGRLSSDFARDQSAGKPVLSSSSQAQQDGAFDSVETIEEAGSVSQYSAIVTTLSGFTSTFQKDTGSQGYLGWPPVITALNAVTAQCQLLGEPTGQSGSPGS